MKTVIMAALAASAALCQYTPPSGGGGGGAVSSVFTRTGAVVATTGDYTAAKVTNAVDTTSTYSNPPWLTALDPAKVTGLATVATTGSYNDLGNKPAGLVLGSLFIATNQSTSSATFTDLSTADSVSITCPGTCNLAVQYTATTGNGTNATVQCFNSVFIDGSQVDDGNQAIFLTAIGFTYTLASQAGWRATGLASGSHTVSVKHKFGGSGSCTWQDRNVVVSATP